MSLDGDLFANCVIAPMGKTGDSDLFFLADSQLEPINLNVMVFEVALEIRARFGFYPKAVRIKPFGPVEEAKFAFLVVSRN
jgi:hypothetical protein